MFQDNQPQQPVQQPETPTEQPVTPEQQQVPVQQAAPVSTPTPEQTQPQAPKPAPVMVPEKTTQEERMWAAISYIAFLGVVSLAIKPRSEFCKHHAANGLTIFVLWFISLILLAMPSFIGGIGGLLLLGATALAIFGIMKAIQSFKLELPVLSAIARKIPTDSIIGSVTGKVQDTTTSEATTAEQPAQPEVPVQEEPKEEQTPTEPKPQA